MTKKKLQEKINEILLMYVSSTDLFTRDEAEDATKRIMKVVEKNESSWSSSGRPVFDSYGQYTGMSYD